MANENEGEIMAGSVLPFCGCSGNTLVDIVGGRGALINTKISRGLL